VSERKRRVEKPVSGAVSLSQARGVRAGLAQAEHALGKVAQESKGHAKTGF